MEAEFKINDYQDRAGIVYALANAGYKVWIEHTKSNRITGSDYYVCVEIPEKERREVLSDCGLDEQPV